MIQLSREECEAVWCFLNDLTNGEPEYPIHDSDDDSVLATACRKIYDEAGKLDSEPSRD